MASQLELLTTSPEFVADYEKATELSNKEDPPETPFESKYEARKIIVRSLDESGSV
jgi:hypothetical protein